LISFAIHFVKRLPKIFPWQFLIFDKKRGLWFLDIQGRKQLESLSERDAVIVESIDRHASAASAWIQFHRCVLRSSEVIVFRLGMILIFQDSQLGSSFDIPGREFFRVPTNARIGMSQESVEGLPFLSADDAFPGDKTLKVSQVLPVVQLGSSKLGTIPAKMTCMAGSREPLIRTHPSTAPAKMSPSLALLCHSFFLFRLAPLEFQATSHSRNALGLVLTEPFQIEMLRTVTLRVSRRAISGNRS